VINHCIRLYSRYRSVKNRAAVSSAFILLLLGSSPLLLAQSQRNSNSPSVSETTQDHWQTRRSFSSRLSSFSWRDEGTRIWLPGALSAPQLSLVNFHSSAYAIRTSTPREEAPAALKPQSGGLINYDKLEERQASSDTAYKASNYVPIDDIWIYSAFDRLAAMGYLPTSTAIFRPWTRLECARLLAEAHLTIDEPDDVSASLMAALETEFRHETSVIDGNRNIGAQPENFYSRVTGISGTPLRDGFHFSQTIVNDFGRPFGKGVNSYDGLSGRAEFGPLAVYLRGEYQYASVIPGYSAETQQYISSNEFTPAGWNLRFGTTSRLKTVEVYVSLSLANWQFSFGQQSLWWAPDRSTSLILSNNAEALPMFRIARAKPMILPGFLGKAGPVHVDMFMARQGGIHYVGLGPTFTRYGTPDKPLTPPPYLWGFAFSIKPSDYLEIGFAHTVIFAGYGRPLTLGTFFHTFSVDGNGQTIDPGKRVTAFNFGYHPPLLRKSLVLYTEAMAWDNPVQGKFVGRYAFSPGIYIPQIPKLPRLDLRLEGVYTDLPKLPVQGYFYNNSRYMQGYTNYGQLLGSWVGPQGIGGEASTTYLLSPRTKASVSYRKMVSDAGYFKGGHRSDLGAKFFWTPNTSTEISGSVQYGRWNFAAISPNTKSDVTATVQVRYFPRAHKGS
jgi:hypothetical protein